MLMVCLTNLAACGDKGDEISNQTSIPKISKIYLLGSSTLENMSSSMKEIGDEENYNVENLAKGGEKIYSTCIRIGALSGTVKFLNTTLVSNSKNYFIADWPIDQNLKSFETSILNIKGNISIDEKGYYFKFSNVKDTNIENMVYYPIKTEINNFEKNSFFIVNLGKNNLYSSDTGINTTNYIIDKNKECISYIQENYSKKIIVLGFFTTTNANADLINKVNELNLFWKSNYDYFYDVKNYIESNQVWLDTNISPNNNDYTSQKDQKLPMSLSQDVLHVNDKLNYSISKNIFKIIKTYK